MGWPREVLALWWLTVPWVGVVSVTWVMSNFGLRKFRHSKSPVYWCNRQTRRWSACGLHLRQSSTILKMCGFRFWQFSGFGHKVFQYSTNKSIYSKKSTMPTFYLVTDKTKHRNRIIKRCKILDSFLITVFFDNTICHLLPIFTKFCMQLLVGAFLQLGPFCRLPAASPGGG